jgi:microcystin-dependent protein
MKLQCGLALMMILGLVELPQAATITPYGVDPPQVNLSPSAVSSVGGSQPHTNFQPYLCVDFIISLFGIFPSPT